MFPTLWVAVGNRFLCPRASFPALWCSQPPSRGIKPPQPLTVNYTDGTSSQFLQSFSDWFTPQKYPREFEGVAMAYRNFDDGTKDQRTFSLYAYAFALNPTKIVQSVTLPNNPQFVVLGATLLR